MSDVILKSNRELVRLYTKVIEQQAEIERLREALDIYAPKPSFMIEDHDQ